MIVSAHATLPTQSIAVERAATSAVAFAPLSSVVEGRGFQTQGVAPCQRTHSEENEADHPDRRLSGRSIESYPGAAHYKKNADQQAETERCN